MTDTNQNLFFGREKEQKTFQEALKEVQAFMSSEHASLIAEKAEDTRKEQMKRFIRSYLEEKAITVAGMNADQLVDDL